VSIAIGIVSLEVLLSVCVDDAENGLVPFRNPSAGVDRNSTHRSFEENTFFEPDEDDCEEDAATAIGCFDLLGVLVLEDVDGEDCEAAVTLLETFVDAFCIERLKAAIAAAPFADIAFGPSVEDVDGDGSILVDGFFPSAVSDADGVDKHEWETGCL
jgi:hypothetical protein